MDERGLLRVARRLPVTRDSFVDEHEISVDQSCKQRGFCENFARSLIFFTFAQEREQ